MTEAVAEVDVIKAAPVAIDPGRLAATFADFGLGVPAAITELIGGGARSFRIDRVDGQPVVLKVFNDALPYATGKETYASQLLRDLDVPMTRFLVDGYGAFGEHGVVDPLTTNSAYLEKRFRHGIERFRHFGGGEDLALRLEAIFADSADVIAESRGAVFAHDDFQPHNVLAERDADGRLQLTGLLDFGNARASDPVCDLAKALFCSEHDAPGSRRHILDGYGPIEHSDPEAALRIYTLVHRVTMWMWLRHVGVIKDGEHNALIDDLRAMVD
jgi:hypothetical protein